VAGTKDAELGFQNGFCYGTVLYKVAIQEGECNLHNRNQQISEAEAGKGQKQ